MNFWKKWNKIPVWSIGLIIGIVCLAIGFYEGQLTEIFRKAIIICLECIGIG